MPFSSIPKVRGFAVLAVIAAFLACSGGPTRPSPADALSSTQSSLYIDFKFAPGDAVDATHQDAFHVWATARLQVTPSRRIQYSKYRDRKHLTRVTGRTTDAFAEPNQFAIHSILPWHAHEAIHNYSALIGRPSDFFNEGLAVALSVDPLEGRFVPLWTGTPLDDIARQFKRNGTLPAIASIVTNDVFRTLYDGNSYPIAGSFVGFVFEARGVGAMRSFLQSSTRDDSAAVIETRFRDAFGWTVAEADAKWRGFLN